jgi:hypothetical protein
MTRVPSASRNPTPIAPTRHPRRHPRTPVPDPRIYPAPALAIQHPARYTWGMARRRRTRTRRTRRDYDRDTAVALGATALICQIEGWWGYAILASAVAIASYLGLCFRRRQIARRTPVRKPQARKPKPGRVRRLSSECAGNDCLVCVDRKCDHACGHPALKKYPRPAPADEIPF